MNKVFTYLMLSSFSVFSVHAMTKAQRRAKEQAEALMAASVQQKIECQNDDEVSSVDVTTAKTSVRNSATKQTEEVDKQQADAELSQQDTNALQMKVAAETALQSKLSAMQKSTEKEEEISVGAVIDSWKTKLCDKWWGYGSTVSDDIKNARIKPNTDGLHRVDRAIEEFITAHDYRGLIDFIVLCGSKDVAIPLEYLKRAHDYFTQLKKKSEEINLVLDDMITVRKADKKPADKEIKEQEKK